MPKSKLTPAAQLRWGLSARGLPEPVLEHAFHVPRGDEKRRRWRFDMAWPELRVACEVEGGTFARGASRHTTAVGYGRDCLKYSMAAIQGWIVVRADAPMIRDGTAAALVARALEAARLSQEARALQAGA